MNANIYFTDMRRHLKGFLIWCAVIAACVLLTLTIVPTIAGKQAQFLAAYPADLLAAIGINAAAWATVLGIYASYWMFFVPLLGAIYAVSLGSSLLAKEESGQTADFLLTKPVSRTEVAVSKGLVLLSFTTALWALCSAVEVIGLASIAREPLDAAAYWRLSVSGYLMIVFFGFLAMVLSVLPRRSRPLLGLGIGIILASYALDIVGNLSDKGRRIAVVSPFHHIDTTLATSGGRSRRATSSTSSSWRQASLPRRCCSTDARTSTSRKKWYEPSPRNATFQRWQRGPRRSSWGRRNEMKKMTEMGVAPLIAGALLPVPGRRRPAARHPVSHLRVHRGPRPALRDRGRRADRPRPDRAAFLGTAHPEGVPRAAPAHRRLLRRVPQPDVRGLRPGHRARAGARAGLVAGADRRRW